MAVNNSSEPIFETDEQSTYFLSLLLVKEQKNSSIEKVPFINLEELSHFLNTLSDQANDQAESNKNKVLEILNNWNDQATDQASDQVVQIIESNLNDKILSILSILNQPKKRAEILENLGLTNHSRNR